MKQGKSGEQETEQRWGRKGAKRMVITTRGRSYPTTYFKIPLDLKHQHQARQDKVAHP